MSDAGDRSSHASAEAVESGEEPLGFACPRCHLDVVEELYGPCASCRTTLRALIGGDAREVERTDYEPKMNVTPNAVASKD